MLRSFRLLSIVIAVLAPATVFAEIIRHTVAPGVEFSQEIVAAPAGPLVVNILRIDLKNPAVRVRSELAGDTVIEDNPSKGREALGTLATRHSAIAAVNADFFPFTGDPLGIAIREGELLSEGLPHRVAMGVTHEGRLVFDTMVCLGSLYSADGTAWNIDGINRALNPDELVLLTPSYGEKTRVAANATTVLLTQPDLPVRAGRDHTADVSIIGDGLSVPAIPRDGAVLVAGGRSAEWIRQHLKQGEKLRFRFDIYANPLPAGPPRGVLESRAAFRGRSGGSAWIDVAQAVGGGPWLVKDGRIAVDGVEQGFKDSSFVTGRHPRTAAAGTLNGELLLVTVDGRQPHSRGMTLQELAEHLLKLGAHQAINLDGGGSTSMVVRNLYVNGNSDGSPRPVANALLVFSQSPDSAPVSGEPPMIPALQLTAGDSVPITLALNVAELSRPVWGTLDGRGFIDQRGIINARKAGSAEAIAWLNGALLRVPYTVLPGPATQLTATMVPAANNPPDRKMIIIMVKDRYANPIANHPVAVKVLGGVPDQPEVKTDSAGRAEVEVVWDTEKGGQATVQSGSLPPIILKSK